MDPVGKQSKISGNKMNVSMQRKIDQAPPSDLDGISYPRNTRSADTPKEPTNKYQGGVEGKITHTFGVKGKTGVR